MPVKGQAPAADRELSFARLIAFALPALPVAAFQLPFVIIVPKYYAETVGLGLFATGFILFAVRLIDAVLDPLIGYGADHIKTRWGRRRTWFGVAAIPTTIGALLVFNPFPNVDVSQTWFWTGWLFVFSAMLSLGYTALSLSHQSWAAESSPTYYGRNRIFAAREVMVVLGTLVATGLPFVLTVLGHHGDRPVLIALSVLVGVTLPLFAFGTVMVVPEPKDTTHHPLKFFASLKGMGSNKPFLRLLAAFALSYMANGIPGVLILYFVRDYLHGTEEMQRLFLLLYFLFGVLSTPLWLWLSKRTSKHRAWCVAMIVACAAFAWTPLIGQHQIGPNSVYLFGVIMLFTGLAVGADLMLPPSIQADVIDVDTARSGEQHTGFYFAIWALATKIALSVAMGLSLVALGAMGFKTEAKRTVTPVEQLQQVQPPGPEAPLALPRTPVPDQAGSPSARNSRNGQGSTEPVQQTPQALWTLAILYAWVPVVLKLIAVALMWNFPIGAQEQARLRAEIEAHLKEQERKGSA
ncbi:MFS transporter [Prosthecomicrobium sp. N25]|uniref:MFS transporter n=1 Tax=Prosthecomicrobium sp. N25 TaxID=3129254 RepID=UPI00307734E0